MKSIKKNKVEVYAVRYRSILLATLLFLLVFISYNQDNLSPIAAISFNPINVSESDAEAITGLLETADEN